MVVVLVYEPDGAFNLIYKIVEAQASLVGQASDGETITFRAILRSEKELKQHLNDGKAFDQDILFGRGLTSRG